jgi:hypothetical protein
MILLISFTIGKIIGGITSSIGTSMTKAGAMAIGSPLKEIRP